ncbi:hypothetical protein EGK75_12765 [Neisseria weixii]|nr:hypothetical protein EGK75_12765 [Neisseria weixii]
MAISESDHVAVVAVVPAVVPVPMAIPVPTCPVVVASAYAPPDANINTAGSKTVPTAFITPRTAVASAAAATDDLEDLPLAAAISATAV